MPVDDSRSSHASCENAEGNADENADILVTQLDINVLMAAMLKEKCVSLEQDGDRGRKLFADVYEYLEKYKVLKPLSSGAENVLHKQKEILDKIMQTLAKNVPEEGLPDANGNTQTTGQDAAQSSRYINEFHHVEKLGKGGFGSVSKAIHKLDGKSYAVKKIPLIQNADMTKPLREVKALANLKHENIMGYYSSWLEDDSHVSTSAGTSSEESESSLDSKSNDAWNACQELVKNSKCLPAKKDKQLLCIQMELCNCTLTNWLQKRNEKLENTLDYETEYLHPHVQDIFRGILCGVNFIHSKGLMHRDLKPDNIFILGSNLHVKIGDFGLVKRVNGSDSVCSSPTVEGFPIDFTTTTNDIGSEMYGSPELLKGEKCDTKCDMYSLGVLLFEMSNTFTTGMERFKMITELREKNRCPGKLRKMWSEWKIQLIEQLISPVAGLRPTAEQVLRNPLLDTEYQTWHQCLSQQNQTMNVQGKKVKKPDQKVKNPDQKVKKPDQKGEKQDQKSKEQVQEHAAESSQEGAPNAQFMGYRHKKKK